jgi:hypothetical protein
MANNPLLNQPRPSVNSFALFILNLLIWGSCSTNAIIVINSWITSTETTSDYHNVGYGILSIVIFFLSYGAAKKLTAKRDAWDALHRTKDKKSNTTIVVDDLFYLAYVWGDTHRPLTYTYVCANGTCYQVHPTAEGIVQATENIVGATCEVTVLEREKQTQLIDFSVIHPSPVSSEERSVIVTSNRNSSSGEGVVKAKYTGQFPALKAEQRDFLQGAKQSGSLKELAANDFALNTSGDIWEMIVGNRSLQLTFYLEINSVCIPVTIQQFKQVRTGDWIRYSTNFFSGTSEFVLL